LSKNYFFAVELAKKIHGSSSFKLLDYGCGAGEIVTIALQNNIDAYGVDVYYDGGSYLNDASLSGFLNTRLFQINNGYIPFSDNTFDIITSNQVFEHIDIFDIPLKEIQRVLKPEGYFINIFPDKGVWREGHFGIPFVHRMNKGWRRYAYTYLMRLLGFGYNKCNKSIKGWAIDALNWLDTWTYYKHYTTITSSFCNFFKIATMEEDYMIFRINNSKINFVSPLFNNTLSHKFLRYICVKLATRVFVLRNNKVLLVKSPCSSESDNNRNHLYV
jgi:ubiquinone/menaquinone biosynthesis C-methylase UbiE